MAIDVDLLGVGDAVKSKCQRIACGGQLQLDSVPGITGIITVSLLAPGEVYAENGPPRIVEVGRCPLQIITCVEPPGSLDDDPFVQWLKSATCEFAVMLVLRAKSKPSSFARQRTPSISGTAWEAASGGYDVANSAVSTPWERKDD